MTTLPEHIDAAFWVGSADEIPNQILFTHEDARVSGFLYIDAFNMQGLPVESYKLDDNDNYTTKF